MTDFEKTLLISILELRIKEYKNTVAYGDEDNILIKSQLVGRVLEAEDIIELIRKVKTRDE